MQSLAVNREQTVSGSNAMSQQPANAEAQADYGLPPVLTAEEVASFLRLNVKTVYQAFTDGQLPGRRVGKRVLFLRDALLVWLGSTERVLPARRKR